MLWCKIHCRKQVCFPVTCRDRSWSMELETRIRDLSQTFHDFFSADFSYYHRHHPKSQSFWIIIEADYEQCQIKTGEESSEKTTRNWSGVMVQRRKDQPTQKYPGHSSSLLSSPLVQMTCEFASCEVQCPLSLQIAFPSLPRLIICPCPTPWREFRTDTFKGMRALLCFNWSLTIATFGTISESMTCPLIACNAPNWPPGCLMPRGTPNHASCLDAMLPQSTR